MSALIEIDLGAIGSNIERLRSISGVDVMGIVKANAYGHGALLVARPMLEAGATGLGVAEIAEGLALRAAGVEAPVLAWLHCSDPNFAAAAEAGIDVGISNLAQLESAGAAGGVRVHLKFDTGLGRNGIVAADWGRVIDRAGELQAAGRLRVAGIMSHLAGTSEADDRVQRERFSVALAATEQLEPEITHLCASHGMLAGVVGTAVRPGISSYGLHPDGTDAAGEQARALGLRTALRLTAPVESGSLAFGWRHGLMATGAQVLVGDRRHTIVEAGPESAVLDAVVTGTAVVIGAAEHGEPTAGEWARQVGTINYEIVTRLAASIERRPR